MLITKKNLNVRLAIKDTTITKLLKSVNQVTLQTVKSTRQSISVISVFKDTLCTNHLKPMLCLYVYQTSPLQAWWIVIDKKSRLLTELPLLSLPSSVSINNNVLSPMHWSPMTPLIRALTYVPNSLQFQTVTHITTFLPLEPNQLPLPSNATNARPDSTYSLTLPMET
jgi:hypothetical protein